MTVPLTSLSHGGGCGCKLAPAVLEQIIARSGGRGLVPPDLLVGIETSDDAAVYRISDDQAIVATTDFFMPIVDDPFDFGAIAATNAISDVYAMGGRPLFALALVAMPIDKLPIDTIRRILEGGESVCRARRYPCRRWPQRRFGRSDLRPGGHRSRQSAARQAQCGREAWRQDRPRQGAWRGSVRCCGQEAEGDRRAVPRADRQHDAAQYAWHATGPASGRARADRRHGLRTTGPFAGGMPRVRRTRDRQLDAVPLLTDARQLASAGFVTGGSARNWKGYGSLVDLTSHGAVEQAILTDPRRAEACWSRARPSRWTRCSNVSGADGFHRAAVIGDVEAGSPGVRVV